MPKNTPQRRIDTRRRNQATSISGVTLSGPAGVTDHGALQGLADDDHSQYLLADGTRTLAGNLAVASGITIDGIDLSAHAANADAHHPRVHAIVGGDHTASGLTAGWTIRATDATTFAWAQLQHGDLGNVLPDQHHARSHSVTSTSDHTITAAAFGVLGAPTTNTIGILTPIADTTTGTLEALLKSDASGGLRLQYMSTPEVRNPSGSITLNPTGTAVLPTGNIQKDMGDYNRKWRTLYAAELYVETLVAQSVISTIGGRVMVTPTSSLIADIASGTGTSITIDVKHNGFAVGEWLYMATAPGGVAQVEVLQVTAGPSAITGGYRYTVNRNQDGSGQNAWFAGDAVASLGNAVGTGYIDLTATTTAYSHLGPTITVYARSSTGAWTGVTPTVSMGNLRSWVDYGSNEYGFALGNNLTLTPTSGFSGLTADRTNGLRMFNTDIALYTGPTRFVSINTSEGLRVQGNNTGAINALRGLNFYDTATFIGGIFSYFVAGGQIWTEIQAGNSASSRSSMVLITANGTGNRAVNMTAGSAALNVYSDTVFGTVVDVTAATFRANGNTVWHSGNDGAGTGLNADQLDGYQASQFALLTGATFTGSVALTGASTSLTVADRDGAGDNWLLYHSGSTLRWWNNTYGDVWVLYPDGQMTVSGIGLFAYSGGGYGVQVTGGSGIYMGSASSGYIYRAGGTMRLAVDTGNVLALIDSGGGSNLYTVIGSSTALYSARLSVYGNIHSNGAVTGELYLQTAAGTVPDAASGWARIALRSSDNALVAVMPSGAVRVLATN